MSRYFPNMALGMSSFYSGQTSIKGHVEHKLYQAQL